MNAMTDHSRFKTDTVRLTGNAPADAWLIVVTKLNAERVARAHLRSKGFEVYVPMCVVVSRSGAAKGARPAPLFPRFVFVRATLDAYRWQDIFSTHGVQRLLCDPSAPRGVSNACIERIRRREVDGLIEAGLRDGSCPAPPVEEKARARWVKLADASTLVAEMCAQPVDALRKSLLTSLFETNHPAVAQSLRKL